MPLRYGTEPHNGSAMVLAGLHRVSARRSPLTGRGIDFAALQTAWPHAVYDLPADLIAGGSGLESAHLTSYRYLVNAGATPVAAAEVQTDASGAASLVANINYGPFVEATAKAFAQLESGNEARAGSFEARLLRIAAIPLLAIWLKADAGGSDLLYPLAPVTDGLQAERLYSADDFLQAIRPLASKRAANRGPSIVP